MIQTILFLHILAGVAALAAAGLAVGSAKGGRLHRRSGNAYTLAMAFVGLSALVLAVMLATQMGAIHAATMMMARRLNHIDTIPQQDSAERALNKLARTFATQMEALKRYRTGGQQKVVVEHVTVNQGGQAIVGNVTRASE